MRFNPLALTIASFASAGLAQAQSADFNLTYHVDRNPQARLTIDACAHAVSATAKKAGIRSEEQVYPGQLVTISGGEDGTCSFIVQCIAVDQTTVSVVQGIDYGSRKGRFGTFADEAFEAVKSAAR